MPATLQLIALDPYGGAISIVAVRFGGAVVLCFATVIYSSVQLRVYTVPVHYTPLSNVKRGQTNLSDSATVMRTYRRANTARYTLAVKPG